MSATTLVELLAGAARAGRGGLRFVDRRENAVFLGWDEILRRAEGAAAALRDRGVEPGDRVALVLRTSPRFFDALFGVLLAGAVPVPLYPPVRLGRLDEYHRRTAAMLDAAGARTVASEPVVARLLGETIAAAADRVDLVSLSDPPPPSAGTALHAPHSDQLALVQFSSGTTVDPKPVALSHRALIAQVRALNEHWQHLERPSGVSWLPLYHDMGLIGCVFPALDLAAELTLIPPEVFVARPAIWLRTLSRYRATISPAPNFAYGVCLEKVGDEELDGVDLSCWRIALNGAEAVSAEVVRRFHRRFARWGLRPEAVSPVYGLSEMSLAVTFSALDQPFTSRRYDRHRLSIDGVAEPAAGEGVELVSVGRPLDGFAVEIRDERGRARPERHVGRVWVRGPSLMEGYLDRPRETARAIVDGWLDTGDRGFLDGGELFLSGRDKDLLILRGRNHDPVELERAVDGVDGVRPGCVAAVGHRPDVSGTERVILLVERRRGPRPSGEIAEACRQRVLAKTGIAVDRVEILEPGTLPRTSSGKIRRQAALERLLDGTLEPPGRFHLGSLLRAIVRSRIARLGRQR